MSRNKKNAVMFAKPEEPAFLRRMKEQLGYKEGPSVDTKREELPQCENEDLEDKDDERPTVVVLGPGDLTADEVEKIIPPEPSVEEGGKIIFKKPQKRVIGDGEVSADISPLVAKVAKVKESTSRKVKDKKLLSFDDEEDDDFS